MQGLAGFKNKIHRRSASDERKISQEIAGAPHPISKSMQGKVCPFASMAALAEHDPDLAQERAAIIGCATTKKVLETVEVFMSPARAVEQVELIPFQVFGTEHTAGDETRRLVQSIGGLPALRRFTICFYDKCFADSQIDPFISSHTEPHGERFATWIAEKMGDGTPWSDAARSRPPRAMQINGRVVEVAQDRVSSHLAAWHSPKRKAHMQGQRFTLVDSRAWMRLHFWAARETGLFESKAWMDYYVRFIAHFVGIYTSEAVPFTRESARWSADPANIERYAASGNVMFDIVGQTRLEAFAQLPFDERAYDFAFPYCEWPRELSRASGLPVGDGRIATCAP